MKLDEFIDMAYDFIARAEHIETLKDLEESRMEYRRYENYGKDVKFDYSLIPAGVRAIIYRILDNDKKVIDYFHSSKKEKWIDWFKEKVLEYEGGNKIKPSNWVSEGIYSWEWRENANEIKDNKQSFGGRG